MDKFKEKLWEELEEVARKPELGAGDLELAHKLSDTIKNLDKICLLEGDGGYSQAGGQGGTYRGGSSYANRGKHYVRGHYSRDSRDDRTGGRYPRTGGYSRDDGRSEMMEYIEMAMDAATDEDREAIKRFMRKLENA